MTFAIVNLRDGTRRDLTPFLLDNDAFPLLQNMYLFRGRIERRSGYQPIGEGDGRLKWSLGNTSSSPFTYTLLNIPIVTGVSQFAIGDVILTDPGGSSPVTLLSTDASYSGTLNRTTGALSISFPSISATPVIYYPGLPALGLLDKEETAVNQEATIGFDQAYSYILDPSSQDWIAANTYKSSGAIFNWNGQNYQQFWGYNWLGALFVTNNYQAGGTPGLNAYTITNGTNATPCVLTIGAGHNVQVNDYVEILNTNGSTTLNGCTFQVTAINSGAGTITINNTVAPGGAITSGYCVVLNRQVLTTVTNAIGGDVIKWYDGPGGGTGWVNFVPPLTAATPQSFLVGALCIVAYKGFLITFNTWEQTGTNSPVQYAQRARWSQFGTPFYTTDNASPPVVYIVPENQSAVNNAWFTTPGLGGFVDAPTNEAIISVEFIKDTLIVYFERSTWQLVFNGIDPFVFIRINTELGSEATFSVIPFDRGVYALGNYGIITTDSVNVERIDQKIPDVIFDIQNTNQGPLRISGIRDYNAQLAYWAMPIINPDGGPDTSYTLTYPNMVLVYNYLDGSWGQFEDSFTCFGVWQQVNDVEWQDLDQSPQNEWQNTNYAWNSQLLVADYPAVVAGNQRGFVFVYSQQQDLGVNSPCLEISNFTGNTIYCPDHNLFNGQYVYINNTNTAADGNIYLVANAEADQFDVEPQFEEDILDISGYLGGGLITQVQNFQVVTKEFNPFYQSGASTRLRYFDILTDKTTEGQITANFYTNSQTSVAIDSQTINTFPESSTSYTSNSARIWHRCYTNTFGAFFQNIFTLSPAQMFDLQTATSFVRIHGLVYYIQPSGRLSYDI